MKTVTHYIRLVVSLALLSSPAYAFADILPDYSSIVEKVLPSVVTITTTTSEFSQLPASDLSNTVENGFLPNILAANSANSGSGFIIAADGYVLTNAHVINNAETIVVELHDGKVYQAKIIGQDNNSDTALLKISATNLIPAQLADSDYILKVGQTVLGIGSPYSFERTVTSGIISYLGRSLTSREAQNQSASYIQTDMPLNPGNSGGPIINGNGNVIGMSSRIFSNTGSSIGISFGIPVDILDHMVDKFLKEVNSIPDSTGILTTNVSPDMIGTLGLPQVIGALVVHIDPSSSADKSGLRMNDVIVTVDGVTIRNSEEFQYLISSLDSDQSVRVTAIRGGQYFATEYTPSSL